MIYRALLKYSYSNFSLDILEYCELDVLIEREQYYINILKPEYNILKYLFINNKEHSLMAKLEPSVLTFSVQIWVLLAL